MSTAPWNSARHTDPKVDEYYARYAREMDPVKRKAMPRSLRSSVLTALYWDAVWLDKQAGAPRSSRGPARFPVQSTPSPRR